MVRASSTFLLTAFVVALAVPVAWGHGDAHGGQSDSERMRQRWDALPPANAERGLQAAEAKQMFGKFDLAADGWASGTYLKFHIVDVAGILHNVEAVDGERHHGFFDEVRPGNGALGGQAFVTGSVLHYESPGLEFMAHNDPSTILQWRSNEAGLLVNFTLAADVTHGMLGKNVRLDSPTAHGHLMTSGASAITNATGKLTIQLDRGEMAMFRFHPTAATSTAGTLHDANAAFTAGRLAALVNVASGEGVAVEDIAPANASIETLEAQEGRLALRLYSDLSSERVVFLTVDGAFIDPAEAANLTILVDGEKARLYPNATIVVSASGAVAASIIGYTGQGTTHIVVAAPFFPESLITIEETGFAVATTPALGAFVALAVLLGRSAGRRRRCQ